MPRMASERYPCVNYAKAFPKVSLRTSLRLNLPVLTRYQLLSVDVRSGSKVKTGRLNQDRFFTEFDQNYAGKLCNSHLNILLQKKEQFVGTKTLNSALRFVSMALKTNKMRKMCQPHIQTILYDLTLPLLLVSQYEMFIWEQDQIEYVRLQVDHSNSWNVKRTNQEMIKAICNIRQTRKMKISPHLTNYLSLLCEQMNASHGDDFRPKEALMHAFGLLSSHMAQSTEYQKHAGQVLMQYVMPEL